MALLFTIESFPDFLRGYVRNAGDLGRVELSRFPHATRQWVRQMRREQGLSDDDVVKSMCVGHANRLLVAAGDDDGATTLLPGASMTTVTCVWMHALAYATFAEALDACFAVFVAHAAEHQGPTHAAKVRDDALALASLATELNTLDHGLARADQLFTQAREAYFKALTTIAHVAATEEPNDDEFAELADMSGEQLSEVCDAGGGAFARAAAVARRFVPATETLMEKSAAMFGEYNALMEELLEWRARAMAEARTRAPAVSRQMLCRAVLVAYDHLSHFDLQAWLCLLEAASDPTPKQQLLVRCIRETERGSVEERRAAPWRRCMHEDDDRTVARLVRESNATARRREAIVAELVDAEAREKRRRRQQPAKQKRRRQGRQPAKQKRQAAGARGLDQDLAGLSLDIGDDSTIGGSSDGDGDGGGEREECVVCLDSPSSVRCEPCGHVVMCAACAAAWMLRSDECPYCRCACVGACA